MIGPHCLRLRGCLRQISAYISDVSKGAQIPPAVEEDPVLVVVSGSTVSAGCFGGCGGSCATAGDGGLSARPLCGSPWLLRPPWSRRRRKMTTWLQWIKLWLVWPLLSMTFILSLVRCPLFRGTVLNLCSSCRLHLSHIVRLSVSLPRLLRLQVLVRQAGGRGGVFALCLDHPLRSLHSTIFAVRWV